MLVPQNDKKELALTEKQETFLTALFGEAKGNPRAAGDIAGYADYHQPLRALKEEIITRAEEQLAAFAPREKVDITAKVQHGIFILPPKDVSNE